MAVAMPVLQAEAVGQVGGDVELAAADVDVAVRRLAERDDAGIEPMDQRAEGHKIQRAIRTGCSDHISCVFSFLLEPCLIDDTQAGASARATMSGNCSTAPSGCRGG